MNHTMFSEQMNIIQNCNSFDKQFLENYFDYIFSKICSINDLNSEPILCLSTFSDYLDLPQLIMRRMISIFSKTGDDFVNKKEFIQGIMEFYFGALEELINFFFKLISKNSKDFTNQDVLYIFKFFVSSKDEVENSKINKYVNHLFKKTSRIDLPCFKNYVLYEDTRLVALFFKYIYSSQPFSPDLLKFYKAIPNPQDLNDSYSTVFSNESCSLSDQTMMSIKDLTINDKQFKIYKIINNKFKRYILTIVHNNVLLFKRTNFTKEYDLASIIPLRNYFIVEKEVTSFKKNRELYMADVKPKHDRGLYNTEDMRLFFKSKDELTTFLKIVDFETKRFFSTHRIIHKIGSGEFGKVFLVVNSMNNKKFAVKIIDKAFKPDFVNNLIKSEVDILHFIKLNPSDNIIKVYEIFEDSRYIYIVMEHVPKNLSNLIKKKTLTESNKTKITSQIARGINFLHSNLIIHRDIKPENILISLSENKDEVEVKIVDFGLARFLIGQMATESLGTLVYSAPEVLRKKPYDYKDDVWSYGIVLYFLYFNYLPFDGVSLTANEVANKICLDDSVTQKLDPKINIQYLIMNCIAKEPINRLTINQVLQQKFVA